MSFIRKIVQPHSDEDAELYNELKKLLNFSPKKIGDIISEVLVLGLPDYSKNPVLVSPDLKIADGLKLY